MVDQRLKKWRLGLLVLGGVTLVLLGYVFFKGVYTKQDRNTTRQANLIATKINDYVSEKQAIPASLAEVGATDVPSSITYTRLSDSKYRFCVTYRAANTDVSTQIQSQLYKSTQGGYDSSYSSDTSTSESSYLYISSEHKAGEQCQTIKPYIYDYNSTYESLYNNSSDYLNYSTQ